MQIFSKSLVAQLRDVLNLTTVEERPNSWLYQKLEQIERDDLIQESAIASAIKDYLAAIAELDQKIANQYENPNSQIKSENINDDYSVTYQDSNISDLAYLQRRRGDLVSKLRRDLSLPNYGRVAWRTRS